MTDRFVDSNAGGAGTGADWANAYATLGAAISASSNADTIYVANNHSETAGGVIGYNCPASAGLKILCVTPSGGSGHSGLATGATISVGAVSQGITIQGYVYAYGLTLNTGTGGIGGPLVFHNATSYGCGQFWDHCTFNLNTTSAAARIQIGTPGSGIDEQRIDISNSTFRFSSTGHSIRFGAAQINLRNIALDASGSIPTTLFEAVNDAVFIALLEASDLSGRAFTNWLDVTAATAGHLLIRNCKVSGTPALTTGTFPGAGACSIDVHNVDSADTQHAYGHADNQGTIVHETTLVRSGGGPVSYRMDSSAGTVFPYLPLAIEGSIPNDTIGTPVTLTVPFLHDSATDLDNDKIALEVQEQGASGFPLGVIVSNAATDVFATPAAHDDDSGASWTTTGMSNPNQQKLAVQFTAQRVGYVHYRVLLYKPSTTVYVDMGGASIA